MSSSLFFLVLYNHPDLHRNGTSLEVNGSDMPDSHQVQMDEEKEDPQEYCPTDNIISTVRLKTEFVRVLESPNCGIHK